MTIQSAGQESPTCYVRITHRDTKSAEPYGRGIFLALTSCVVAVVPALALTKVLGTGLGELFMNAPLPYRVSALAVGIWLALVILGAALATDAAATRASRITVREALAYL